MHFNHIMMMMMMMTMIMMTSNPLHPSQASHQPVPGAVVVLHPRGVDQHSPADVPGPGTHKPGSAHEGPKGTGSGVVCAVDIWLDLRAKCTYPIKCQRSGAVTALYAGATRG